MAVDAPYYVVGEPEIVRVPKLNRDHRLLGSQLDIDGGDATGPTDINIDIDGGDA
jgi:hypothetical protein